MSAHYRIDTDFDSEYIGICHNCERYVFVVKVAPFFEDLHCFACHRSGFIEWRKKTNYVRIWLSQRRENVQLLIRRRLIPVEAAALRAVLGIDQIGNAGMRSRHLNFRTDGPSVLRLIEALRPSDFASFRVIDHGATPVFIQEATESNNQGLTHQLSQEGFEMTNAETHASMSMDTSRSPEMESGRSADIDPFRSLDSEVTNRITQDLTRSVFREMDQQATSGIPQATEELSEGSLLTNMNGQLQNWHCNHLGNQPFEALTLRDFHEISGDLYVSVHNQGNVIGGRIAMGQNQLESNDRHGLAIIIQRIQVDPAEQKRELSREEIMKVLPERDVLESEIMKECSICQDDIVLGEKVMRLSQDDALCCHLFHTKCIVAWLQRTQSCPVCRYVIPGFSE